MTTPLSAVVVGAGPGGITVLGNLLEHLPRSTTAVASAAAAAAATATTQKKLLWVDPQFRGGRINARYREVPSNTKVELFNKFAHEVSAFRDVVERTPKPNAVTALEGLPQDKGCSLSYAADLCLMLTEGLRKHPEVESRQSQVTAATLDKRTNTWDVKLNDGEPVLASRLILCTGSSPISKPLPILERLRLASLQEINLDTALAPSILARTFEPGAAASQPSPSPTVAVVGASHSAILVLMNLVELARTSHPRLRIKWFTRNRLRYAEYMDGWILRDNTGLKGQAAEWARQNLDFDFDDDDDDNHNAFADRSPVRDLVTRVWTAGGREEQAYQTELPGCTHIVQAVGYENHPLPQLHVIGPHDRAAKPLDVEFDHETGRFFESPGSATAAAAAGAASAGAGAGAVAAKEKREYVPGIFGAGIAFPERVVDPHGNVEYAVGFWKFMKYVSRVAPGWLD